MGQIIQMPAFNNKLQHKLTSDTKTCRARKVSDNQLTNSDSTGAQILFFTGVRYERLDEDVFVPIKFS